MHSTRRWLGHPLWHSCTYLRASRQQSITRSQSLSCSVLLANITQRRGGHSQKVHCLSKVRHKATDTRISTKDNTIGVAFRQVGTRHGRTTQKFFQGRPYLPSGGSRQIHQVDWSSTHHKFGCYYISQFHKIHHISLWCPKQHHHGQWDELHSQRILVFLQRARHHAQLRISGATAVQRPSRKSQRTCDKRNQETPIGATQKSHGCLGRKSSVCAMETAHNSKHFNTVHHGFHGLWSISSPTIWRLIQCAKSQSIWRRRRVRSTRGCSRPAGRGTQHSACSHCSIPARSPQLPQPATTYQILRGWWLGTLIKAKEGA